MIVLLACLSTLLLATVTPAAASGAVTQCGIEFGDDPRQCWTLLKIYQTTNGQNWTGGGFRNGTSYCTWKPAVTCAPGTHNITNL
jgi:hypothetical protein